MADIRFYHLERQMLADALPRLMAKVLEASMKAVIKCPDSETLEMLDKAIWTYDAEAFLPHDVAGCKFPEEQPIYLTEGDENPAGANVIVLVNNAACDDMTAYERCLYMFDGRDEVIVDAARADWKKFKEYDIPMSYWQQPMSGGWEQKA